MKRFLRGAAAVLTAAVCLASVSCKAKERSENNETVGSGQAVPEADPADGAEKYVSGCTVFFKGEPYFIMKGEKVELPVAPFVENGCLYLPAAEVTVAMGGSFASSEGVYYLSRFGNVTAFMEEYNVILFSDSPFVMDAAPEMRDGVLCIPAAGLARAMSVNLSRSPADGIFIFENYSERLPVGTVRSIGELLGRETKDSVIPSVLEEIALKCGADAETIAAAAMEGGLWTSDSDGAVFHVAVGDDGAVRTDKYDVNTAFPADSVFLLRVSGGGEYLFDAVTGAKVSESPRTLSERELKRATGRYMELKAASCLLDDKCASELADAYLEAICVSLSSEKYREDLADPYETGLFGSDSGSNGPEAVFGEARPGDFILFSAGDSDTGYGYFGHCALVIEKEGGTLRLLHARGAEYGVGADLEMDLLSGSSFENVDYYRSYNTVFLCRAGDLDPEDAAEMARNAYERFNGCRFGYGGRLGLDEVNCAEIVTESYRDAGVEIVGGNRDTRLKEVLSGDARDFIIIPDDLMLSDVTEVVAVWKR